MSQVPRPATAATASERTVRIMLVLLGVGNLALGVWQAVSPGSFFASIGGFGPRNDHYARDMATLYLALGLVILASVGRSTWRLPVLLLAALQSALHLVNHLIHIADATPGWVGPIDAGLLAVAVILFGAALQRSRRRRTATR